MLKICLIALITIILSIILKRYSLEFSMIISIAGGLLILVFCFDFFAEIISYYSNLSLLVNVEGDILKTVLKIISVGFIVEFMSDLAVDFGNTAIASKVIFGGKVVICLITLPIVKELISLLFSLY